MKKIQITEVDLYCTRLIHVIKSKISCTARSIEVNGRNSDAFVYILSGSCTYVFENRKFTVYAGDILYLAYKSQYKMYIGRDVDYHFIYCDFTFDCADALQSEVYTPTEKTEAENLFQKLYRSYLHPKSNGFYQCMSYLYRICSIVIDSINTVYINQSIQQKMTDIQLYIDHHYNDPDLNITALSEMLGISEVYFRKNFKSRYHISPSQYITSIRIEKAKQLLSYPFIHLEECARQCGFASSPYFCRVFKSYTGVTPSQFKKERI